MQLAFVRYYARCATVGDELAGVVFKAIVQNDPVDIKTWYGTTETRTYYPTLLSEIDTKVIRLDLPARDERNWHYSCFTDYKFQSAAF